MSESVWDGSGWCEGDDEVGGMNIKDTILKFIDILWNFSKRIVWWHQTRVLQRCSICETHKPKRYNVHSS